MNNSFEPNQIILIVFSIIAIADLVFAIIFYNLTKKFIASGIVTKAKIIKLERYKQAEKAHFTFVDELKNNVESSTILPRGRYNEGAEIEIIYDKNNPKKLKINNPTTLWTVPIALVVSALTMLFGLFLIKSIGAVKLPF